LFSAACTDYPLAWRLEIDGKVQVNLRDGTATTGLSHRGENQLEAADHVSKSGEPNVGPTIKSVGQVANS
jgi:hypothetical protein